MVRLLTLAALFLSSYLSAQPLQLKLKRGATYREITHTETVVVQEMGNQKLSVRTVVEGSMAFRVQEVARWGYRLQASFEYLRHSTNMNRRDETVDTRDIRDTSYSRAGIITRLMASVIGQPMEVCLTRSGRVLSVTGADALWLRAVSLFPQLDSATRSAVLQQALQNSGDAALAAQINMSLGFFPENGDAANGWTVESYLPGALPLQAAGSFRLDASTTDTHLIVGEMQVSTTTPEAAPQADSTQTTISMGGKIGVRLLIDRRTGWVMQGSIVHRLEGESRVPPNRFQPKPLVFPLSMSAETRVRSE